MTKTLAEELKEIATLAANSKVEKTTNDLKKTIKLAAKNGHFKYRSIYNSDYLSMKDLNIIAASLKKDGLNCQVGNLNYQVYIEISW